MNEKEVRLEEVGLLEKYMDDAGIQTPALRNFVTHRRNAIERQFASPAGEDPGVQGAAGEGQGTEGTGSEAPAGQLAGEGDQSQEGATEQGASSATS